MIKTLSSLLLGLLLLAGVSVENGAAQATPAKAVNVGVVNGKAITLPKPEYPVELRNAGIEGIVSVTVTIDATGAVTSAEADLYDQRVRKDADGNVLEPAVLDAQLRASAESAARAAKFSPVLMNDTAVAVKGKIVYNFVAKAAEPANREIPKTINGGVLNGKAATLPMPEYPAAAKAVGAQGAVSIQITIDESGNVISATAVSGHPLLRAAAEAAAMQARFSPTLLAGNPVKISGILTYNFVI